MKYKTLLDYKRRDRLLEDIKISFYPAIWLIDLDPKADSIIVGPFESFSEAHDCRDYIWHYGDQFGRYVWYVSPKTYDSIVKLLKNTKMDEEGSKPNIELEIDTGPLEVVAIRFVGTASIRLPSGRK